MVYKMKQYQYKTKNNRFTLTIRIYNLKESKQILKDKLKKIIHKRKIKYRK